MDPSTAESPRIAELRRRLQQSPSVRLLVELAREYHETGLFEEASRIAARAVREQPSYVSARVQLGRIYFDMGRLEEAREQMEAVLSTAPDNLMARRIVAEVCREMGDVQGALDRYRALLAFSPADEETRRKIESVEKEAVDRAGSTAVMESPPAAPGGGQGHETALEPGVLATPTLAELYLQQGLPVKAASVYREILRGDPGNAEAVARLSEIEGPPPAPADPRASLRRRKVQVLEHWLAVLRGQAGGG